MTTSLGRLFGTFLGIEFKEDSLVVSFLKNRISGISLLSSSAFPLKSDEATIAEISEYIRRQGVPADKVFVSIPDKWAITKFADIPAIKGKGKGAVANLMRFEIERHIPFNVDEVFFDFLILSETGAVYSVVFIAVNKEKIDYIKEYLEKLALRPDAVIPSSFAVLNAIELSGVSAGGIQEIIGIARRSRNIGKKGETNISLYFDKLTVSISIIKDGLCAHQKVIALRTIQDSADEICRYLTAVQARHLIERFHTLMISGDLSSFDEIVNALKEKLGAQVISLDRISEFSRKTKRAEINMLAPSVGACFAGLGISTYAVNLLPHKMEYETRKLFPLSTIIFLVLIVVLAAGIFSTEAFKKKNYLAKIETELQNNTPLVTAVEKLSTDIDGLKKQINLLRSLKDKEITLEVLAELANLLPADAWITNLEYKVLPKEDKKKGVGEIIISGFAASSSALIPVLEDSPYLDKVAFVGPVKKTGDKEQFKLSAEVVMPLKKNESGAGPEEKTKKDPKT